MKRLAIFGAWFALISLILAGCSTSLDDSSTADKETKGQSLQLFSFQPQDQKQKAINFGFSPQKGWHLSRTETIQKLNLPTSKDHALYQTPIGATTEFKQGSGSDFDFDQDTGQNDSGSGQSGSQAGGGGLGSTLSQSASGTGAFQTPQYAKGYVASFGTPAFQSNLASTSFSNPTPRASSFTGTTTGGSCSLTPICDFAQTVCRVASASSHGSGVSIEGCDQINRCYSQIDSAIAQSVHGSQIRGYLCLLSDFFSCATQALNRGGLQGMQACASTASEGLVEFISGGSGQRGASSGGMNNGGNTGGSSSQDSDGDSITDEFDSDSGGL